MSRFRQLLMLCLFASAGLVILFVGSQWILTYQRQVLAVPEHTEEWQLLLSLSGFTFLALYLVRQFAAYIIRWAVRSRHPRILRFFQRIAPRLSRKVLGSMLGTSIALCSAAAATASPPPPTQDAAEHSAVPEAALQRSATSPQASVPTPQWFPETLNIPLDRLATPGAGKPRDREVQRREVVIAEGQNLWSVAAEHLGAQATTAEIAAYWPKIYQHNQPTIGADPDLLQIGTVLELPPTN